MVWAQTGLDQYSISNYDRLGLYQPIEIVLATRESSLARGNLVRECTFLSVELAEHTFNCAVVQNAAALTPSAGITGPVS